jgi:hypothetical protein
MRIGGLFRCCTELTIPEAAAGKEGDSLQCPHCRHWVRFDNGAWEWSGPNGLPRKPWGSAGG